MGILDRNGGSSPHVVIEKSRNGGAAAAVFAQHSYSNASSPGREGMYSNIQPTLLNSARRGSANGDLQMYQAATSVAEELSMRPRSF